MKSALTITNIDDVIRYAKRHGMRAIVWDVKGWSILSMFVKAANHPDPIHLKNGVTYMGVRHYLEGTI